MRRLDRRDGVLVDELRQPIALEQHAEQVERRDMALEHHAIDEEHRHAFVGLAHRVEEDLLEQRRLLAAFPHRFDDFGDIDLPRRHDRRDGVLVDQLRLAVAAQQHREIVEPGDDSLKLDALHEEHRHRRLRLAKRVEERSEEHTSELQSLMRISYAVFCLKKKNKKTHKYTISTQTYTYHITHVP